MSKNDFWNAVQTLIDKNVRRSFGETFKYSDTIAGATDSSNNINGNSDNRQPRTGTNGRKIPLDGIFDASTPKLLSMRLKNNKDSSERIRFVIHRGDVEPENIPLPKYDLSHHPGVDIDLDSIPPPPPPPPPPPEQMPVVSPITSPDIRGNGDVSSPFSLSAAESEAISTEEDEAAIPDSNRSVVRRGDSIAVVKAAEEINKDNHGDIDYRKMTNRSILSDNSHLSDRNGHDDDYRNRRDESHRRKISKRNDDDYARRSPSRDGNRPRKKYRRSRSKSYSAGRSRSRSPAYKNNGRNDRRNDLREFLNNMTDQYHKPINFRRNENVLATDNGNFYPSNRQTSNFRNYDNDLQQLNNTTIGYSEEPGKFTFFFTKKYPFSNHYPCRYENNGRIFTCTEQEYMFEKAKLFGDKQSMDDIMDTSDPKLMKNLGRKVVGFDQRRWDAVSYNIMLGANRAKYTQNRDLRLAIFTTEGTTLVETNPMDPTWGIGMGIDDPRRWYKSQWRGKNWLGEILTYVRDELMNEPRFGDELCMVRAAKEQFIFWG